MDHAHTGWDRKEQTETIMIVFNFRYFTMIVSAIGTLFDFDTK